MFKCTNRSSSASAQGCWDLKDQEDFQEKPGFQVPQVLQGHLPPRASHLPSNKGFSTPSSPQLKKKVSFFLCSPFFLFFFLLVHQQDGQAQSSSALLPTFPVVLCQSSAFPRSSRMSCLCCVGLLEVPVQDEMWVNKYSMSGQLGAGALKLHGCEIWWCCCCSITGLRDIQKWATTECLHLWSYIT